MVIWSILDVFNVAENEQRHVIKYDVFFFLFQIEVKLFKDLTDVELFGVWIVLNSIEIKTFIISYHEIVPCFIIIIINLVVINVWFSKY